MLIYSPETEDKKDRVVNFIHCDVIHRDENRIDIFIDSQDISAITCEYKTAERAKQVFSDLMRAITDGKNLFIMSTE